MASENGITYLDDAGAMQPVTMLNAIADGFSNALGGLGTGKRQPRRYSVANTIAMNNLANLTTLIDGDTVVVTGTNQIQTRIAGVWKLTSTTASIAWPFNTTTVVTGNGVSRFTYSLDGDRVSLRGVFTLGSSSSFPAVAGGLLINLPFTAADGGIIGTFMMIRAQSARIYQGIMVVETAPGVSATGWIDMGLAGGVLARPGGVVPFNAQPVAGDQISLDLSYRRTF